MKQNKKNFRYESLQDQQTMLKILTAVTDGLEKGKLVLRDDADEIVLNPQGLLQIKVTATQEDNRCSFGLKVSWQIEDEKTTQKNMLHISTDEVQ
jgi:amphi-Trp domain-containing protein